MAANPQATSATPGDVQHPTSYPQPSIPLENPTGDFSIHVQVANGLYYNAPLVLNVLQKLNIATEMFNLWFQLLEQTKKSGVRANFKRHFEADEARFLRESYSSLVDVFQLLSRQFKNLTKELSCDELDVDADPIERKTTPEADPAAYPGGAGVIGN
ncbi:unnamed protein product [Fraxinus pennsylvanica]|uniref:Uncharacterized protein n=1 Tax=Fraxinus pennsylvanica TaxID=56036 RepID=A0AAD2E0U2_9LAMI|nr:unnamed protein product [Fraxinus pennsylvanica]